MGTVAEEGQQGGIGGKLRTRQLRRAQATPYDRPAAGVRGLRGTAVGAAEEGRGSRWISRLVDPASTLITKGATRLFSSVLRKRLGAPHREESPVGSFEPRQAAPDVSDKNHFPEVEKQESKYEVDSRNHSNGDDISELEQLLKQKTFTRAEYEHLMELIHSQTVDVPKVDDNKRNEPSISSPADDYKKQDENLLPQESRIGSSKFIGITSSPGPTLKIPEEEIASPAEVAKAYMGSRSSKVSPSSFCLRSQLLREATTSPSFIGFAPKSSAAPICSKSVVRFSGDPGTLEDGYMTPRLRGRSATYKMSCSPYFKGKPAVMLKDGEPMECGYPGLSMSTQTPTKIAFSSGKQILKRSCSALESDLGSIGTIRRIRQKSNLVSPSEDGVSEFPGKLLPTANASAPLHSREMAEKILQQLDKLVPSPKGESAEAKRISSDALPPKLSPAMLHGMASKNAAKLDASQLFNVESNGKLGGSSIFHAAGPRSSVSPMKDKGENGHSKSTFSETRMASEGKGVGSAVTSIAETGPVMVPVASIFSTSNFGPMQKRSAFKMQAPADSPEQEDDCCSGKDISDPSAPGREKLEVNDHKSVISETAITKKTCTSSSESRAGPNIHLNKVAEKGVSDGPTITDKDTSFTFQVSLPPSTQSLAPLTPTVPSLHLEVPVISSEQNAVPLFTFGFKSTPLIFSASMVSYSDPAGEKVGASSNFRGQLCGSSSTNVTMTTAPVECTELDEAEKGQKAGHLLQSVETSRSFGLSTLPTSSGLPFVTSPTSSQSNGSLTSNSSTLSTSSASAASLSGSSTSAIVSAGPPGVSSSSSGSSSFPVFCVLPSLRFGSSSSAVSTDSTLPLVKSVSTVSEPKLTEDSPFGMASSSAAVSSIFSSTGSSIFGFSSSALPSAATFGKGSGPGFGSQAAQSGSGTSFGESTRQSSATASPTFGFAGSSFGFSSSAVGSSSSIVNPFGLSSGFVTSSTLASSPSSSSFTSNMTCPSVFGSSSPSTAPSIFHSDFGSSASYCSVSTFGMSFAASSTTSFSSSSMSPFSVCSSAATTPSIFSFAQATATGSSSFSLAFGATSTSAPPSSAVCGSSGNDQMNVEHDMADDTVQAPNSVVPTFGQPSNVLTPSLPFGSTPTPSGAAVFQFASSQPSAFPQSQTPVQATSSLEFGGSGSFSMGSGGGDKSGRRFIKVKRDKHGKK